MEDSFYIIDSDNVEDMEFDAIRFIDLMRLAKKTWDDGYDFDIDPRIIEDAVPMAPAKIVSRTMLAPEDGKDTDNVYRLWCAVAVEGVDYLVVIPVHVYVGDYKENVFKWVVAEPNNKVDLNRYVSMIEESEDKMWSDLLD